VAGADSFVYLSKLLPEVVYPLTLAYLSLFVVLFGGPLARWRRAVLASAIGVLWLGGNDWVSEALTRSLERQYLPEADPPAAGAIVVLGGATEPALPPRTDVELGDAGERLMHAARLFQRGKAPIVLVCAGRPEYSARPTPEAPDMAEVLRRFGVPKDAILEEDRSRNTFENAVEAKRMLEPLHLHRILLVTSALHMPRAVGLFRHQGFEVVPAPADFKVVDVQRRSSDLPFARILLSALIPSAEALAATTKALREHLGIAVYSALGLCS
jgi:uncharacterized SAM-binding protein YcdF (DUF218 family)